MKRAILMVRVSSDEQAKGYSLDIQEKSLRDYCHRKDIEIVSVYREDHSAQTFNRPEFNKLLEFVKKSNSKIDYLFFTTWDRFSRNTTDAYEMLRKLNKLNIEVQAVEQYIDFGIPENKLLLGLYLSLPHIDNERRGMKIFDGVKAAKQAGRWPGKGPFGYKNDRDEYNKPIIIPDEKAEVV
ncbi:MAG: recombinase family protein, partial [Flavitalea sp.]